MCETIFINEASPVTSFLGWRPDWYPFEAVVGVETCHEYAEIPVGERIGLERITTLVRRSYQSGFVHRAAEVGLQPKERILALTP